MARNALYDNQRDETELAANLVQGAIPHDVHATKHRMLEARQTGESTRDHVVNDLLPEQGLTSHE